MAALPSASANGAPRADPGARARARAQPCCAASRSPGSRIPSMSFVSPCLACWLLLKHCKGEVINSDHS